MDTKLYWTTDSTTCANCGAQLSRTGRHLSVKRGSEPVPIWTCESCDMDFVQYQDNSAVIQFEKSVFCKYLPDFLGSTVKAIKDAEENQSVSGLKNLSDAAKYLVEADRLAEEQARIAAQKALEAAKEKVLRAFVEPYRYLYETYSIDSETLTTIFDFQPWASEYLASIYVAGHKPLELAADDDKIPIEKRNKISAYFKEKYREQISARAQEIKDYFKQNYTDGDSPLLLDDEQAFAIALDKKRVLVSARAGSGKTRVIASKILYLLDHEHVPENAIISLSFNVNVKNEVSDRINEKIKCKSKPDRKLAIARTFHSLAFQCASVDESRILDTDPDEKSNYIHRLLEAMKERNPDLKEKIYKFFRDESYTVDRQKVKFKEDFYDRLRNHTYKTLDNHTVKSLGEKWIADYFFEHGINYYYEYSFFLYCITEDKLHCSPELMEEILKFTQWNKLEPSNAIKKRKEMKPDFYLPNEHLVIEHWGIDENETDPNVKADFTAKFETSWEKYYEIMQWKRRFWAYPWGQLLPEEKKRKGSFTTVSGFLETSVNDMGHGREDFESKLEELFIAHGIHPVLRDKAELVDEMWSKQVNHFADMMVGFINKYQQHFPFLGINEFENCIELQKSDERKQAFWEIGYNVLNEYEKTLALESKPSHLAKYNQYTLDFNQLMVKATGAVKAGNCDDLIKSVRYILVDEYQDFSELFYQFIKAIIDRNPEIQLFCVGDPWQAINRFAGADTKYFENFKEYFGDAYVTDISTNYRSYANIIIDANRFMLNNGFPGVPARYYKADDTDKIIYDINLERIENHSDDPKYYQDQRYSKLIFKESQPRLITAYLKFVINLIKRRACYFESFLILSRTREIFRYVSVKDFERAIKNELRRSGYAQKYIDKVRVKTIHSSKGDEADNVIILGANQYNMPLIHPDTELYSIFGESSSTAYIDEARLFYVAVTRPKKKLIILYDYVDKLGKIRPSPFIAQMDNTNGSILNATDFQKTDLFANDGKNNDGDIPSYVDISGLLTS